MEKRAYAKLFGLKMYALKVLERINLFNLTHVTGAGEGPPGTARDGRGDGVYGGALQEERSYSQEGGGGRGGPREAPDSPRERISISLPSTNSYVLKTGKTHCLFLRQVLNVGWVDVERCKLSLPISLRSPAVKGLSAPLLTAD